jgi:hypothetical protein
VTSGKSLDANFGLFCSNLGQDTSHLLFQQANVFVRLVPNLRTLSPYHQMLQNVVRLHPVAHCYFTFTFLSDFCAAYRCF